MKIGRTLPTSNTCSAALFWLMSAAVAGCSSLPPDPDLASLGSEIFGGTADTTTDTVQALLHLDQIGNQVSVGGCSGTTVATRGGSAFFLTAAHCAVAYDAQGQVLVPVKPSEPSSLYVIPGTDWGVSYDQGQAFSVVEVKVHPQYNGNTSSPYDVAVLRYVGAPATARVAPWLTPQEDMLAVGTMVTFVGYGRTESNGQNTQRRRVDKAIAGLFPQQIQFDQSDGRGPCEGDSGGPAFVQTANGLRVAGVTSFGDTSCRQLGVSVRASYHTAFIQAFINAAPQTLPCNECSLASVAPGMPCAAQQAACQNANSACNQFYQCASPCTTASCVATCRTNNAAGAMAYSSLVACGCGGACMTACATEPGCGSVTCGAFSDPRPSCNSCVQEKCCAEAAACKSNAACAACPLSASSACATNIFYRGLVGCVASCTGDPCQVIPVVVVDAGAPVDAPPSPSETSTPEASTPEAGTSNGMPPDATPPFVSDSGTPVGPIPGDSDAGNVTMVSGSTGCSCRIDGSAARERAPIGAVVALAAIASRRRRVAKQRASEKAQA